MKTTVLIICGSEFKYNVAGASRAWHIATELNNLDIVTLVVTKKAQRDSITGKNIIAVNPLFNVGLFGNLLFLIQISSAVIRILFSTKIGKVIVRGPWLSPLFILFKFLHKDIIYDFHGYGHKEKIVQGSKMFAKIVAPFDWLALKLSDHVLVIREELRQDLPSEFQKKALLLPNGVDLEEFTAIDNRTILARYVLPEGKLLVGFIGNWEAWVAIEDMLESAQYFDDNIKIVIIGEGRKFKEYKLAYPSILFTGRIPHIDTIALLKTMAVCICPYSTVLIAKNKSYRKVLEYLAAGKPIVSSNAKSRESFLKEGENTLIYDAGHPEDLAAKVKTILNDAKLYHKMSCTNLDLAKQFSWKEVINRSGLVELLH